MVMLEVLGWTGLAAIAAFWLGPLLDWARELKGEDRQSLLDYLDHERRNEDERITRSRSGDREDP